MDNNGWVKNWRKIENWEWYTTPHMAHLFQHLIRQANHKPRKWQGVVINTGQFITSQESLSVQTGLSRQTIRTCLDRLKSTKEIAVKSTSHYTLITIAGYKSYQSQNGDANQQLTSHQPATNHKQEG